jgi:hypothetical protein
MEPTMDARSGEKQALGPVVQIDEGRIQAHLDGVVRSTVEEALNALLDPEADHLCGARKYERKDTRAGSYDRQLHTKAGEVTLTVSKLRSLPFETAIIESYRRRESSVEEAQIEMCLAGVSVPLGGGHHASLVGGAAFDFKWRRVSGLFGVKLVSLCRSRHAENSFDPR